MRRHPPSPQVHVVKPRTTIFQCHKSRVKVGVDSCCLGPCLQEGVSVGEVERKCKGGAAGMWAAVALQHQGGIVSLGRTASCPGRVRARRSQLRSLVS
jgi:hypothetical protein